MIKGKTRRIRFKTNKREQKENNSFELWILFNFVNKKASGGCYKNKNKWEETDDKRKKQKIWSKSLRQKREIRENKIQN